MKTWELVCAIAGVVVVLIGLPTAFYVGFIRPLRFKAEHDGLTGLFNRSTFFKLAEKAFREAKLKHEDVAFLVMDVDNFKRLNDTEGHSAGDARLRAVAAAILASVREHDVAGRVGGEEFAVLLVGCGKNHAPAAAERMRAAIEKTGSTASIGVADRASVHGVSDLFRMADMAMYAAKQTGKNKFMVYDRV
ncbi:MAG: GGDEF domain-containing protein [Alicyclobacillaceae bacterium]|nr:GGDEF domain-containing protein [Alicyclobacillaceae bacterium]